MTSDLLRETFNAYVVAERAADRAFLDYKFGDASEPTVWRAQRLAAAAKTIHLAAIERMSS